jgi:hypothetical protein
VHCGHKRRPVAAEFESATGRRTSPVHKRIMYKCDACLCLTQGFRFRRCGSDHFSA